ncbi:hypothetical protein BDF19DRAFT_437834 [Syncephalis fuscata]|nr:hypothetical protein BDF19DRAFT_437834 [Syncephalis fuscata]
MNLFASVAIQAATILACLSMCAVAQNTSPPITAPVTSMLPVAPLTPIRSPPLPPATPLMSMGSPPAAPVEPLTSVGSPPIKTKLSIEKASWRGVCSDGLTDNLRYIVKSKSDTMQNVLLVSKAAYDQFATKPGMLMTGTFIDTWTPLSCTERNIKKCAYDSALKTGVTPLKLAQWCIIAGNRSNATEPLVVEFDVGWRSGEGPNVTQVSTSFSDKTNESALHAANNSAQHFTGISYCLNLLSYTIIGFVVSKLT